MIKIELSGRFDSDLRILGEEHPELVLETKNRIKWFRKNPQDTRIKNHALRKRMEGKWAFSITGDIRIVYEWKSKNIVRFLAIGKHKKVYGK